MTTTEITKGVYWVGAIDWNQRNFHGFTTERGITYNAYLVVDEKIALIDTVKALFYPEMVERIKEIVPLSKIDYVIANHGEYDHSSGLLYLMEECKNAEILCSQAGVTSLRKLYQKNWDLKSVQKGDTLSLGKKTLQFFPTPMHHWPDSMVTYLKEDSILFSNDAFGQHIASSKRYADELGIESVFDAAAKYYANIIMPLSVVALSVLNMLSEVKMGMIAPSHGLIFRSNIDNILSLYTKWAKGESNKKVIVVYDTMWGATEKMAKAIVEGIISEGIDVDLYNLSYSTRSDIAKEILLSKAFIVGSPTLHDSLFPTVAEFLYYIRSLKPKNKIAAAFGVYGWKKGITEKINTELKSAKIDVIDYSVEVQFAPNEDEINSCIRLGKEIAALLKN